MAEGLPEELQRAEKEGLAYTEVLLRLARAQWHHRQETALEWRIRQARLPERWALETFPFKEQPAVNKRQIMSLAELDFIPTATNIVFIGPTGVGKSGLATGLLLKALQNGYRALFIKAQDLFDDLYASLADRSSRKLIDRLARVPLLCIDEMGYLTLRPEQSNIFFKLMEERYRRRASIITTNLDYDDWLNFLGNKHMVTALLSRLRHQCTHHPDRRPVPPRTPGVTADSTLAVRSHARRRRHHADLGSPCPAAHDWSTSREYRWMTSSCSRPRS